MKATIAKVHLEGFKRFTTFDLDVDPSMTILVGDNETGKSSVLKAIAMALTGQYEGRLIQNAIDPYMFNATAVAKYFEAIRSGNESPPPRIIVEVYFDSRATDPELARLRGTNNTKGEDCPGLAVSITVEEGCTETLKEYVADQSNPAVVPVEYYKATWRTFSGNSANLRGLPFRSKAIDTSQVRLFRGPARYLSRVAQEALTEEESRRLSLDYRKLQHQFSQKPEVKAINDHLQQKGSPSTSKTFTIQMDMSSHTSWDSVMTAYLDDLPFDCAGMGEQGRVQLRLAIQDDKKSDFILVEEPENHLSHANLNGLLADLSNACIDRQVIIATHSAYVLNRLGIHNLRLISRSGECTRLAELSPSTKSYFMKLPGYDTLRLILSSKCILVEGASDELIVQRTYRKRHGKLPLADGIDVISVGSLAFKRFLEIAGLLSLEVRVVIDNDGDVAALRERYAEYLGPKNQGIQVFYDEDEEYPSLEEQLLKANSLDVLNAVLGTAFADEEKLLGYMRRNKTECALRLFEKEGWTAPAYIEDAVTW
jgi:putative ATP-dependent endonuclease of OLD family